MLPNSFPQVNHNPPGLPSLIDREDVALDTVRASGHGAEVQLAALGAHEELAPAFGAREPADGRAVPTGGLDDPTVAAQGAGRHAAHVDGARRVSAEHGGAERERGERVAVQRVGLADEGVGGRDEGGRVDDGPWVGENRARERHDGDGGGVRARGCLDRRQGWPRGYVGERAREREVGRLMRIAGGGGVMGAVDRRGVWRSMYGTDGWEHRSDDLGHNRGEWGC